MPPTHGMPSSLLTATSNGALTPGPTSGLGPGGQGPLIGGLSYDPNPTGYDFFDPQHWMLDNLLDFSYGYVQPLEGS